MVNRQLQNIIINLSLLDLDLLSERCTLLSTNFAKKIFKYPVHSKMFVKNTGRSSNHSDDCRQGCNRGGRLEILVQPGFWFTVLAEGSHHLVTNNCNIFIGRILDSFFISWIHVELSFCRSREKVRDDDGTTSGEIFHRDMVARTSILPLYEGSTNTRTTNQNPGIEFWIVFVIESVAKGVRYEKSAVRSLSRIFI